MPRADLGPSLAWHVVKALPVGELLKRSRNLASRLSELDQGYVDLDDLQPIAAQFATGELLHHRNKGVAAYSACSIADILRLSAPDAPFSRSQLVPVFQGFIRQLQNLHDTEGAYYAQYFYLLESLATIESVVLACDLPDKSELLISDFFTTIFGATRDDQRKNTEAHMISILSQLINEAPTVPPAAVNVLLMQFRNLPATSLQKELTNTRANREIASAVCNNCADRLQRQICQHFTEVICKAADYLDEKNAEAASEALENVHELVLELFKAAPTTLQNVIPQLESELNVENIQCRIVACKAISGMLASVNGTLIITQYGSTYQAWTNRRNDKSSLVRAAWARGVGVLLHSTSGAARLPEIEKLCVDGLTTKFHDSDERVRIACCVVADMPYDLAKDRLTAAVLAQLAIRCRDRKPATQAVAFSAVSGLLGSALPHISLGDKTARNKFGPLTNELLNCLYINDLDVSAMLEDGLYEKVLDVLNVDDRLRSDRLLELVTLADEKARKALFVIIGAKQVQNSLILAKFVQVCEKYNGGLMDQNEFQITELQAKVHRALALKFSDSSAAERDLMQFARANVRRLYSLLQVCLNPQLEHRIISKAYREFRQRVSELSPRVALTMETILRRSSYLALNRTSMPFIWAAAANPHSRYTAAAQELLKVITGSHADIYRAHLEPMIEDIKTARNDTAIDNLKAFAAFARTNSKCLPHDTDFVTALEHIVLHGLPGHVKQAVTILCSLPSKDQIAVKLMKTIISRLAYGNSDLLRSLSAIAQFSLLAASAIEIWANEISSFCLTELLLKTRTDIDSHISGKDWLADDIVEEECLAKCLAIRILGNRLRAFSESDTAIEIARPVFRAFQSIIDNVGEVSTTGNTPPHHRSRLRLQASCMMVKLAHFDAYERLIGPTDFTSFALNAQDLEYKVRSTFLTRLQKSLHNGQLSNRFFVILFLAAHDPDEQLRQQSMGWARRTSSGRNAAEFVMESMLPRLVHLLAHHPDFMVADRDESDLLNFAVYFNYYFDAVVTQENFVLVYHYTQRLKQVADVSSPNSEEIYVLSDIAEAVFAAKAEQKGWPRTTYPKVLKMPKDLFCALQGRDEAVKVQTRPYISSQLREAIRHKIVQLPKHRVVGVTADSTVSLAEKGASSGRKRARSRTTQSRQDEGIQKAIAAPGRRSSGRHKKAVVYDDDQSTE